MKISPRIAVGSVLLFLAVGCQTAQIAKKVELIAFSSELNAGKRTPLKAEACGVKVLGYGPTPQLRDAIARVNVRYANKVEIDRDFHNYVVFTKDCWHVTGEGFN